MSWVTVIWSMVASACLTLGGIYLMVWSRPEPSRLGSPALCCDGSLHRGFHIL